jgi:Histidine kinase-, DNA gyrase B-, and HSP90-like ATPase
MEEVKAYPRKRFFVEMLTRDISLEDCILDLVDNAIDSLLRAREIDIEKAVLGNGTKVAKSSSKRSIKVTYDSTRFSITDDCGGILKQHAKNDVFCFGPSPGAEPGRLGVYGIGLKRAILKLGRRTELRSHTHEDSYRVRIDLEKWLKDDGSLDD